MLACDASSSGLEEKEVMNDPAEERRSRIWSVNAWVGMNQDLSPEARNLIFQIAIHDTIPDATDIEVSHALGIIQGIRDSRKL